MIGSLVTFMFLFMFLVKYWILSLDAFSFQCRFSKTQEKRHTLPLRVSFLFDSCRQQFGHGSVEKPDLDCPLTWVKIAHLIHEVESVCSLSDCMTKFTAWHTAKPKPILSAYRLISITNICRYRISRQGTRFSLEAFCFSL